MQDALDARIFINSRIRYHDTRPRRTVDHHHRDAMMCSLAMRRLFPPCDEWTVNYEPPKKPKSSEGAKGGIFS